MTPFIVAQTPPKSLRPLHIVGNRLQNDLGQVVQLQGVMLRRTHWYCDDGGMFTPAHFQTIRDTWNCNAVKILVNPYLWVSGCPYRTYEPDSAAYRQTIMNAVATAQSEGLYVLITILDYYMPGGDNYPAPRYTTIQALGGDPVLGIPGLAQIYATDQTVLIELFSEPNSTWVNDDDKWCHGTNIVNFQSTNYLGFGIQDEVLAVRRASPGTIILGGDRNLNESPGHVLTPYYPLDNSGNYGWSLHCYRTGQNATQSNWDSTFGTLADSQLMIAGEFGDVSGQNSDTTWIDALMPYMQSHLAGWFVWTWDTTASPCILDTTDPDAYLTGKASTYGQSIQNFYLSNGVVQR
jgi:hypothetical protein